MSTRRRLLAGLAASSLLGAAAWAAPLAGWASTGGTAAGAPTAATPRTPTKALSLRETPKWRMDEVFARARAREIKEEI